MKPFFMSALALFSLLALIASVTAQNTSASIYVIGDDSGSMCSQIEGQTNMSVAAKVLTATRKNLQAYQAVALVDYGHRTKECDDVEFLLDRGTSLVTSKSLVKHNGFSDSVTISIRANQTFEQIFQH